MRWPWRSRSRHASDGELAVDHAVHAKRALMDAQNLAGRAERVSDELAETLRRNHFGAAIAAAMRGEP